MPLNIATFEQTIAQKIASATCSADLLFLGKAMALLRNGSVDAVTQVTDLPSAATADRQMFFVECDNQVYFASCGRWISMQAATRNELWAWGCNGVGVLGIGNTTTQMQPVQPVGCFGDWINISVSNTHALGVRANGTLWSWGNNNCGQLGTNNITSRSSPGTVAGGGTTWSNVGTGTDFSAGVKTDGTLWTWGASGFGVGGGGTINRSSPGTTSGGGTNWSAVQAGHCQMIGLKTDGTLWTWGYNQQGGLGIGYSGFGTQRISPVTTAGGGTTWCAIGNGSRSNAGIKTDGTLWTWGENLCGQLGEGTTTSRNSPGTVAGGGTTWCFVSTVSVCGRHRLAIKTDGTLWSWGNNDGGQLGDGSAAGTHRSSPGTVAGGGTTWCTASSGNYHSGAIKTDGTLWTWGKNDVGALAEGSPYGFGFVGTRCSPGTTIRGGTCWWKVSAGYKNMMAIERF